MANFLDSLLSSFADDEDYGSLVQGIQRRRAGANAAPSLRLEDDPANGPMDIPVVGRPQMPPAEETYAPVPKADIPSPRGINVPQTVVNDPNPAEQKLPHKGMFGVKGTLRDILGTLGDAFLVQSGNDSVYDKQREREKQGDAAYGFTQAPMAAIERLNAAGFGDEAAKMYDRYQTNEAKTAAQKSLQQTRDDAQYDKGLRIFGQFMGSADERTWPVVKQNLERIKEAYNLGDEFQIPENYDPAVAEAYLKGGTPASTQITDDRSRSQFTQKQAQTEKLEKMKEEGRNKRDNPPPVPRASSALEVIEKIGNIPEAKRTPGQKAAFKKATAVGRGKGSALESLIGSGSIPPPPPRFKAK